MDLPDRLMGRKLTNHDEVVDSVYELLHYQISASRNRDIHFRNAGEIRTYTDTADMKTVVLVPLPYLHIADVTTDELQRALGPMVTPEVGTVTIEVAPPPDAISD